MSDNKITSNIKFDFLKGSYDFLNILLNTTSSCVILLDKELKIKAYNSKMLALFPNEQVKNLVDLRCGEAIGCAHQIEEQKECGKTSHCSACPISNLALSAYMNSEVYSRKQIKRPFFNRDNKKIYKHFEYTTRFFDYNDERYIIMIIDDLTKYFELSKRALENKFGNQLS